MTQDEVLMQAEQAQFYEELCGEHFIYEFAKLVAAHAVAKDRKEFDIDELCARQNKIGYKQGYNAGVLAEREACAKVCDAEADFAGSNGRMDASAANCADAIRARGTE